VYYLIYDRWDEPQLCRTDGAKHLLHTRRLHCFAHTLEHDLLTPAWEYKYMEGDIRLQSETACEMMELLKGMGMGFTLAVWAKSL